MTDARMTSPSANSGRLDLIETLREAAATMPAMWRGAGGALALNALALSALALSPLSFMAKAYGSGGLVGAAIRGAALVTALIAWGAITRIGVAGSVEGAMRLGLGRFGVQFGKVEVRLLGAGALCSLFMIIMLVLLALVALAMFGFAGLNAEAIRTGDWAAVGPGWKLALLAGVGMIVLGAPVVLGVRLSLFAPATVGRGQMISLTATGLTNGAMRPLLGGLIVCALPSVACLIVGAATGAWTIAAISWAVSYAGVQAPLTAGFLGAAYRRLETHEMLGAWQ